MFVMYIAIRADAHGCIWIYNVKYSCVLVPMSNRCYIQLPVQMKYRILLYGAICGNIVQVLLGIVHLLFVPETPQDIREHSYFWVAIPVVLAHIGKRPLFKILNFPSIYDLAH